MFIRSLECRKRASLWETVHTSLTPGSRPAIPSESDVLDQTWSNLVTLHPEYPRSYSPSQSMVAGVSETRSLWEMVRTGLTPESRPAIPSNSDVLDQTRSNLVTLHPEYPRSSLPTILQNRPRLIPESFEDTLSSLFGSGPE